MRKIYQELYYYHNYGNMPDRGIESFIKLFDKWLKGNIIDLGCGRGKYVKELQKKNYKIVGIDFVDLKNILVGDITKEMNLSIFDTAICLDVFEHLTDEQVIQVLKNMQTVKYQVIHINNKPSKINGYNLHINIKPYSEWRILISKYIDIYKSPYKNEIESLCFCKSK